MLKLLQNLHYNIEGTEGYGLPEKNLRKLESFLSLYDGHVLYLWCKSIRGVVADEPHSDSQVSSGDTWERRSDSEIVA
ncbi:MAG: hypothetical protein J1F67_12590 [Muribaculaceae bacterium]|nr:hypothetical protein [Muribaculaceae bacterium]